jgi:hypothetical protein
MGNILSSKAMRLTRQIPVKDTMDLRKELLTFLMSTIGSGINFISV